jgi:serine/threonine protein kinase
MALQPGDQLGPHEIVALLGMGGMGEVSRGRDPRVGRDVALKVISPKHRAYDRGVRFKLKTRTARV